MACSKRICFIFNQMIILKKKNYKKLFQHTNGIGNANQKLGEIRMIGAPYELLVTFKLADEYLCDPETERIIQNALRTLGILVYFLF